MNPEGHVSVCLDAEGRQAPEVSFELPGDVEGLVVGREPQAALRLIPALYSVCGTAQAHAAVTAVEAALGMPVDRTTAAARLLCRVTNEGWQDLGASVPVAMTPPSMAEMRTWLNAGRKGAMVLPGPQSARTPETTVFSRRLDDPLLQSLGGHDMTARLGARLLELAGLPEDMRRLIEDDGYAPAANGGGDGFGYAAIDAARGLLMHAALIENGRIAACRVLPPTRWNFDAAGVAARCLSQLPAGTDGDRLGQARIVINAIDPCVACEVRIN